MRLYSGKIPLIGTEIVKSLAEAGDIEVTDRGEAEMDVQAVLKEYVRLDREITEKAKDLLQKKNLPYEQFGKIKRTLAGEKAFGLGEDGLEWMTTQMIESFMQSPHVEEIYVEDTVLRKRMSDILKKHMQVDEELDEEVRRRIKNLEEGTSTWEVEYGKVLGSDQAEPRAGSVVGPGRLPPPAMSSARQAALRSTRRPSYPPPRLNIARTSWSMALATAGRVGSSARKPGVVWTRAF